VGILIEYDNKLRSIPHIPFIVEIHETLCYIVEIPMTKAAQEEYLKYFGSVEINNPHSKEGQTKVIGYKCFGFQAFCSRFEIIGGAVSLRFEPYKWMVEREQDGGGSKVSLDKTPAIDREAMEIYLSYKTQSKQDKVNQIVDDLKNNKIRPNYLKNNILSFYEDYKRSKRVNTGVDFRAFEQEMVRQSFVDLGSIKTNNNSKKFREKSEGSKHPAYSSFDLLVSYLHILERQGGKKNKKAMKEALLLFYPDIPEYEMPDMVSSLVKKAGRHFKGNKEINVLFPDLKY